MGNGWGIFPLIHHLPLALNIEEFIRKFLHFAIFYGILTLEEYRGMHYWA